MGRTISVRFKDGKPVPPRTKDPKKRAEAIALGEAFLKNPGPVVTVVNPELPDEAKAAARALLQMYCGRK